MSPPSATATSATATNLFASVDVHCWIGGYPFREIPHPDPDVLVKVLTREGFGTAWVGHLPGAFHRDPTASNRALYTALGPYAPTLLPAPIVRPDWPGWRVELERAKSEGAMAVRAYPMQWGYGPESSALAELAYACGESGLILQLTVRFEDLRQRHPMDSAGDLSAAAVRAVARLPESRCHLMVLGGGRELIEEIYWGLTTAEQARVWFDFGWVWGPPENHFAHLVRTMSGQRFVVGSAWPLRLTQQCRALVDLLPPAAFPAFVLAEGAAIAHHARRHAKTD